MSAKYEVVLQFALAPRDVAAFNRIARLQEELSKASLLYRLSSDDCTAGTMEIVLDTDDPSLTRDAVHALIAPSLCYRSFYREARSCVPA